MPYLTGRLKFYTVAEAIRLAVHNSLSTRPDRSCVVPGAIPWDQCDCGMLAVSIGRIFLSNDFPNEEEGVVGRCSASWEVAEIVVQVIRCAPQPLNGESAPSAERQDKAARIMAMDAQETLAAVTTWLCAQIENTVVDGIVRAVEPMGPEGGCVGSELSALIAFPRG